MSISLLTIPSGWKGTERTIQEMQTLVSRGKVDWHLIRLASAIVRSCKAKDYLCEATKIFAYLKRKLRYQKDPVHVEMIENPWRVLERKAGDCDSTAVLLCAMLEAIGLPTAFKTIKADPERPDEFSHIYSLVFVPSVGWKAADLTVEESYLGWEPEGTYEAQVWKSD